MTGAMVYSATVVALVHWLAPYKSSAGGEVAAGLGVALGILVVLRNNSANDRWWEARKLWGQLINDTRNLALKAQAHADVDAEELRSLSRLVIGFADALRMHLRGKIRVRDVPGFERESTDFPHAPGYLAELVHRMLADWNRRGKLKDTIIILDRHSSALMDICGACERIRHTQLASSYRALVSWAIAIYVLTAPWAVALETGWRGLPLLAIEIAFLLGMEFSAEAVEEPFGHEGDDLPLDEYCRTIAAFVRAALETGGT